MFSPGSFSIVALYNAFTNSLTLTGEGNQLMWSQTPPQTTPTPMPYRENHDNMHSIVCVSLWSYINVLFTLRFVSVHEANDELPSNSNSCTISLRIATSDHTPPVGSNDSHSSSHYKILLTSNELPITCSNCRCW